MSRSHLEAVYVRAVSLEVRFLFEAFLADVADVLWILSALVAHVTTQRVLAGVRSSAGGAGIRFSMGTRITGVVFSAPFALCNRKAKPEGGQSFFGCYQVTIGTDRGQIERRESREARLTAKRRGCSPLRNRSGSFPAF